MLRESRKVNIEAGERVEADLDRLITKRHDQRRVSEGERAAEALWQESVRRYNERVGETRRLELPAYHGGQAERLSNTLGTLSEYHEAEAEEYRANGHHKGASA